MANKKSLLGKDDQNFGLMTLLDEVLEEGTSLSKPIKEYLASARQLAWEAHEKKYKPEPLAT